MGIPHLAVGDTRVTSSHHCLDIFDAYLRNSLDPEIHIYELLIV